METIDVFWEVPGFWPMAAVLVLFAAIATLFIVTGPTEAPFDDTDPAQTQPTTPEHPSMPS